MLCEGTINWTRRVRLKEDYHDRLCRVKNNLFDHKGISVRVHSSKAKINTTQDFFFSNFKLKAKSYQINIVLNNVSQDLLRLLQTEKNFLEFYFLLL